jgi:hypothetical protein
LARGYEEKCGSARKDLERAEVGSASAAATEGLQSKLAEQQKQIIALESQCRRTKDALIDANRRVREFYG